MKRSSSLTQLHGLLIRRLGGRAYIPKGSDTDQVLRTALEDALFAGACAERTAALGRIRTLKLQVSPIADAERATLGRAEDAVMSEPVTTVVHALTTPTKESP